MGNLTISLTQEQETLLRNLAHERYAGKKGSISKVIIDALAKLEQETKRGMAIHALIEKMEQGYSMGKLKIKNRAELYDRR